MKNKICVIFTGGTISCEIKNKILTPTSNQSNKLIDLYNKTYGNKITFDCLYPINILSENISENNLTTLFNTISAINDNDYDGIIITHGTDTLHFTANLFSFTINKKIPIVFVSSLYPLEDKNSNGLCNFFTAVKFILQKINGVFVSFKNNNDDTKIYLGSHVQEIDYNGNLYSFSGKEYATYKNDKFVYNYTLNKKNKLFNYKICNDIAVLNSYFLQDFSLLKLSDSVKAVILKTYHSGTFCSYGENCNVLNFANFLKKQNIPLIISPVIKKDCVYESFRKNDNIIFCYNQSFESCIVKTMLALGNNVDIKNALNTEYNNEFIK